jgi:signal transduction histidine kinase
MGTQLGAEGVMFVCTPDEPGFGLTDVGMISTHANQAALLLQLAAARRDNEELRIADDRRQIADDLRDRVIARLSRLALDLQALASHVSSKEAQSALLARVDDTDDVMRELRNAIFALRPSESRAREPGPHGPDRRH